MDDIILSMEVLRNQQKKKLKEYVRLDDDQAPFGTRVPAST